VGKSAKLEAERKGNGENFFTTKSTKGWKGVTDNGKTEFYHEEGTRDS